MIFRHTFMSWAPPTVYVCSHIHVRFLHTYFMCNRFSYTYKMCAVRFFPINERFRSVRVTRWNTLFQTYFCSLLNCTNEPKKLCLSEKNLQEFDKIVHLIILSVVLSSTSFKVHSVLKRVEFSSSNWHIYSIFPLFFINFSLYVYKFMLSTLDVESVARSQQ